MPTSEPTSGTRIAFLGLGAMGLPMASNLVEAGFEVAGFDVVSDRSAALAAASVTKTVSKARSMRELCRATVFIASAKWRLTSFFQHTRDLLRRGMS